MRMSGGPKGPPLFVA